MPPSKVRPAAAPEESARQGPQCDWRALAGRLIQRSEAERRDVAGELHEEIGQCLSAVRVQLALVQRRLQQPEARAQIASAAELTEHTLERVRQLSRRLHPPQLHTLGLGAALRALVSPSGDGPGPRVELHVDALREPVAPELALAVYRIVEQALSNARRHAAARRVAISLATRADGLHLEVRDDGVGFDAAQRLAGLPGQASLGLLSMTEGARLAGGVLRLDSAPGLGTRIAAVFPCDDEHDPPGDSCG